MDNELAEEQDIIDRLWAERYGPTRFACRCGCTRGYPRRETLGRSKVCRDCGAEYSVTANTLMHRTRLPLRVWVYTLQHCQLRAIPRARTLSKRFGIADSSAWHLIQRVLRWAEGRKEADGAGVHVVQVALRRPKAPLPPSAPPHILALAGATEVSVSLAVGGARAWRREIGVDARDAPVDPVGEWLQDELRSRRNVSLRWLPRWVDGLLALWSQWTRPWLDTVRNTAPLPLHQLQPWRG